MNDLIKIENGEVKLDSRMVAEHFGKAHSDVLKDIRDEIEKLENAGLEAEGIFSLGEYFDKNNQARPCYEMTEEGALQLAARYDAVARRKLIIKIKELKAQIHTDLGELSPQLQLLISMERKQNEHDKAIADTNTRIDGISDIVALNTSNWRVDSKHLIVKIAQAMGGNDYIKDVTTEIVKALNKRFKVSLERRLTLKRQRMAEEGVCKSKRDKLTKVDIIAEDSKLIEGYVIIVKEMAIKHGVANA